MLQFSHYYFLQMRNFYYIYWLFLPLIQTSKDGNLLASGAPASAPDQGVRCPLIYISRIYIYISHLGYGPQVPVIGSPQVPLSNSW